MAVWFLVVAALAAPFNELQLLSYLLMNAPLTNYSSVMCT